MSERSPNLAELSRLIRSAPRKTRRRLVALAGAPASGKSTLTEAIVDQLNADGCVTAGVPMDGFHLDNRLLEPRGLLPRKGSPDTFDVGGFARVVTALAHDETAAYPLFDRSRDIAIAGAGWVDADCDTVVIEGNYLLLDQGAWDGLRQHWDISFLLNSPMPVLRSRLIQRWLDHGLSAEAAEKRAEQNDLPNAQTVLTHSTGYTVALSSG